MPIILFSSVFDAVLQDFADRLRFWEDFSNIKTRCFSTSSGNWKHSIASSNGTGGVEE